MKSFGQAMLNLGFSVVLVIGALGGFGYMVVRYIDDNYGDGTSGLVVAVLIGIGIAILIQLITGNQNNMTHRAAGEDITIFAREMAKTQKEILASDRIKTQGQYKLAEIGAKRDFEEFKEANRTRAMMDRIGIKSSQRKAEEEAEDADWRAFFSDEDEDEEPVTVR